MRDPDGLIGRAGVAGDPDRDQHFLVDDRVLDRIPGYLAVVGDAEDAPPDAPASVEHVLEIGAGTGALTDRLLRQFDRVTAIERDPTLVEFLETEFAEAIESGRLDLVEGDALEVPLPDFDASISNLPYGVASELLFRLLPERRPLVVTVQLEFGERMVADPGTPEYGRLSVAAGHYADLELVETVPPEAFSPPPAVESAVVRTTPRTPTYEVPDDETFLRFVKALFTQRRKTTRNAIRNTTHISGIEDADAVLAAADESVLDARPGALPPETFARLCTLAARAEVI